MPKNHQPETWLDARRGPPGRRQYVFANTGALLPENAALLREHCNAGVKHEQALLAFMLRFKGDQTRKDPNEVWPPDVIAMDVVLDRCVVNLNDLIVTMERVFAGKPQGKLWAELRMAILPQGSTYYTAQPYIEEASRVAALLEEIEQPRWSELTTQSLLADTIAELEVAHAPYAAAVQKFQETEKVSWEQIKTMDLANHRSLCQLIAGIHWELRADDEARKKVLGPALLQDQAIYELLRRRQKVVDIDPTTGDPTDEPVVEPAPTPVP